MLVGERMTKPVITVHPDMPIQDALILMHKEHVRRFPVVDHKGRLIGLISESDLLNAKPSEATTLSVWEISYLLSKITVERVMTRDPITVTADMPIEDAARIMADHKIGSMPVMRGDELIGIITETDLFKIFLELLGARQPGIRVTAEVFDQPGKLAALAAAIYNAGGNIISMSTFAGDTPQVGINTFKVSGMSLEALKSAIAPVISKIIDIRETKV